MIFFFFFSSKLVVVLQVSIALVLMAIEIFYNGICLVTKTFHAYYGKFYIVIEYLESSYYYVVIIMIDLANNCSRSFITIIY